MPENYVPLESLKSENYSMESYLDPRNRKVLNKMFRYIHTFPLREYETELIRKDLIGMAMEAEKRQESFPLIMDKKPKEFCNDLICAIGGIVIPKGRTYLRIAGWYYCIAGGLNYLFGSISLISLLLAFLSTFDNNHTLTTPKNFIHLLISALLMLAIGYLYNLAGKYAKKYSGYTEKADHCLKWGIGILIFDILYMVLNYTLGPVTGSAIHSTPTSENILVILQIISLIQYIFPAMYIIGAYKNKKEV